jgi:hypothetical protein
MANPNLATLNLSFLCTDCEELKKENEILKNENNNLKNIITKLKNKQYNKTEVIKISIKPYTNAA